MLKETEERLNEILDGKTLDELMQEQLSFSEQIPLLDAVKSALKALVNKRRNRPSGRSDAKGFRRTDRLG